ncbi:helix-turn-helix domain-containing protein [Streptomyces sp. NPDC004596]
MSATRVEVGVSDAAARLGCSPEYVRRLARRRRLSARWVGRTWLVDAAALAAGRERKMTEQQAEKSPREQLADARTELDELQGPW